MSSHTLELLCRVQASNIFTDGYFNGDAHPGNILLLEDGRLGLIDYGQVKTMTMDQRINYAKLILAISRDDRNEIIRLWFDVLGTRTKKSRADIAYRMACFYNDRYTNDVMQGHNLATFMDHCESEDPMIQLAADYLFAMRASMMLRGNWTVSLIN